ncbi:pyruvate dehydrogenase E1 component subunit alpha, somatic form, mitochondrial-like [Ostrea edulis]|uniref:pyruvate dehydrogenase E1 component subunit alpha, somatic form, mitochondrial-like n=1 Tax=Ostrea edulis TaxID=37623 RepID=UPI0024AF5C84|nr:pyruvate dehydrogenase E1 component subunit alpha, somatic form, mitochondrial-like [Ostrea edulis]XP_048748287.2 pyruvate dehydrogenase E1 component subunit alpha, somatic form, mitochondrial-like [Ostrea edulis]XP_048748288.2 pyruvate dehydrogenase E1 component subunit alpha, somatic form, mitochondrial-like [Ostrea edulis]
MSAIHMSRCWNLFKRTLPQRPSYRNYVNEAIFDIERCPLHKLECGPPSSTLLTRTDALNYYKVMLGMREIGYEAQSLYDGRHIRGLLHLCEGMEAVRVGVEAAITPQDILVGTHRIHGWAYARGISAEKILGEFLGRSSGCCKGKGGAMHMYSENVYGGNGLIGASVPLGTGVGFAMKYNEKPNVSLSVYGEGAANQGQHFEAFNMAKLWNLPCIYLCENSFYSVSTTPEMVAACTEYYTRGDYLPGLQVDGMDFLAVREALRFAREHALNSGPILIEAISYRYSGHSVGNKAISDSAKEDLDVIRQRNDPIETFKKKILAKNLTDIDELKSIEDAVREEVRAVTEKVKMDQELPLLSIYEDVYQNVQVI